MSKDNKIKDVLEKQLDVQKGLLENSKEHKEIAKKQSKDSMPLWEKRAWNIITPIGISGIFFLLYFISSLFQPTIAPDYDISVQVSPDKIKLNEKNEIIFEFTFKNIGKRNLTNFQIFEIDIYRNKDKEKSFLYSPRDSIESLYCYGGTTDNFIAGEYCKLNVKMYSSINRDMFDDKDNPPQFLVYIKSTPPIENKIVNTTIY